MWRDSSAARPRQLRQLDADLPRLAFHRLRLSINTRPSSSLARRPPIQEDHREHRDQNDAHDEPCEQIERYAEHARTLITLCDKLEAAPRGCS
jgi:hypothetical protein